MAIAVFTQIIKRNGRTEEFNPAENHQGHHQGGAGLR